ncbi:MAG: ATP-dependent helicase [Oscillatoria sp. PMC 1068.18]|nr:ATP-dependent helicase [Oscillatoria sp. PMC 1076.18]MEC4990400.1 ATP-dependent helicase [Oscillatoria sp. PMC 1068.18]
MSTDRNANTSNSVTSATSQAEYLALREQAWQRLRAGLRPGQQTMADWQSGMLAVSAVPGAGKSHSLALTAAAAIANHRLNPQRQLVVVTFTRSAAASIKQKIKQCLQELFLPPGGFVVHTLHGLALNIASRHPELSGLNLDTTTIVTTNQTHRLLKATVEQWIATHPQRYQILLAGMQFDGEETERLRRQSVLRTEVLPSLANTAIREAKSSGLLPEDLFNLAQQTTDEYQILACAAGLYEKYQNLMAGRNFIDYDDLILAALRVLDREKIRQVWQNQVFAVFEDEAQDSSPLQEKLVKILAISPDQPHLPPNLIRVGDPNQAINSTFTPADPIYFNWFCHTCQEEDRLATMNQAGRSSQIIIQAANYSLNWVNRNWEKLNLTAPLAPETIRKPSQPQKPHELPFRPQNIRLVDPGDPQPDANPASVGQGLELYTPADIYETVKLIGKRIIDLFQENPNRNAAILVRENRQGSFVAQQLEYLQREHEIKVYEVGEVERHSHIPGEILKLLQFIDRPHSPDNLKAALEVLQNRNLIPTQDLNSLATFPEQFLYPSPLDPPQKNKVKKARQLACQLLNARLELPDFQLISFLGMTLNYTGSELATVQKLAERVARQTFNHSSLKSTLEALQEIVNSERFEGVEEDSDDRYTAFKQLTIITMHKAKGLDWDYVFLPFLHEDTIPGQPWVPTGAKFLGDFTLAEVARVQIRTAIHSQYQGLPIPNLPEPLEAWSEAAKLKKAEEFRLLYVAMTRAKRLLWISAAKKAPFTWNTFVGDRTENLQSKKPCPIIFALQKLLTRSGAGDW